MEHVKSVARGRIFVSVLWRLKRERQVERRLLLPVNECIRKVHYLCSHQATSHPDISLHSSPTTQHTYIHTDLFTFKFYCYAFYCYFFRSFLFSCRLLVASFIIFYKTRSVTLQTVSNSQGKHRLY